MGSRYGVAAVTAPTPEALAAGEEGPQDGDTEAGDGACGFCDGPEAGGRHCAAGVCVEEGVAEGAQADHGDGARTRREEVSQYPKAVGQ